MTAHDQSSTHPRPYSLSTRDALRSGATPRDLYSGAYTQPHRGVQFLGTAESPVDLARAFLPRMRQWHAFGDVTAARLWGLPIPSCFERDSTVHIVVPTGRNKPKGKRVQARSIRASLWERTELSADPVATPALTWALLARVCSVRELVVIGDALVTTSLSYPGIRRPSESPPFEPSRAHVAPWSAPELAQGDKLEAISAAWGRTVGATRMRAALPLIRTGVDSPMETLTRLSLVDAGFPEPVVGHEVFDGSDFAGRVDLAYPELRIAIEYDGKHHWAPDQARKDLARINRIQKAGWLVIRITNDDLFTRPQVFHAQLRDARRRRGSL